MISYIMAMNVYKSTYSVNKNVFFLHRRLSKKSQISILICNMIGIGKAWLIQPTQPNKRLTNLTPKYKLGSGDYRIIIRN